MHIDWCIYPSVAVHLTIRGNISTTWAMQLAEFHSTETGLEGTHGQSICCKRATCCYSTKGQKSGWKLDMSNSPTKLFLFSVLFSRPLLIWSVFQLILQYYLESLTCSSELSWNIFSKANGNWQVCPYAAWPNGKPYGVRREWPSVMKIPQRLRQSQTGDNTTRGVFLME